MHDDKILNAIDFLSEVGGVVEKTGCLLPNLANFDQKAKLEFISNLSPYERIGLMACYRICMDKVQVIEMHN